VGEVARLRTILAAMAPAIALLLGILVLTVPLRLAQGLVPTPILPLLIVYLYALYDPDALPAPVIFAAGLLHDFLDGEGIGLWASVYLLVTWMTVGQRTYFLGRARDVVWLGFAAAATVAVLVLWLEHSLLSGGWVRILPALYQLLVTILIYPVCAYLFFSLRARAGVREEWQV
jgi:rod shape-determining protein MreD